MRDAVRRLLTRREASPAPPLRLPEGVTGPTLAVCHPEWRGVRTAARAFGDPLVESADAGIHARAIIDAARDGGASTLVVHAFPPGADRLLTLAKTAGLHTRAVAHSSPAQHGAEVWEAAAVDRVIALARDGVVDRVGFVKAGVAEVFSGMGIDAVHTPNRAPRFDPFDPLDLGPGKHIGVFAAPFWRKNVVTQLAAVSLMGEVTAHVLERPVIGYLDALDIVEHGEVPWPDFVRLQGSVDLNLYVSLSECHPMSPMESYLAGVPCLISRTSDLFRDDPDLWKTVTVSEADDPTAIAASARRLLDAGTDVVDRAREWITAADAHAARRWAEFTDGAPR